MIWANNQWNVLQFSFSSFDRRKLNKLKFYFLGHIFCMYILYAFGSKQLKQQDSIKKIVFDLNCLICWSNLIFVEINICQNFNSHTECHNPTKITKSLLTFAISMQERSSLLLSWFGYTKFQTCLDVPQFGQNLGKWSHNLLFIIPRVKVVVLFNLTIIS